MGETVRLDLIVGARPNFVKAAAIQHAVRESFPQIDLRIIHTGQHNDGAMYLSFVDDLDLDIYQNLGNTIGTPVERLAKNLTGLELEFHENRPDWVMVVGDTDATLAGALAASKLGIPVAHVEAGLRCGDDKMQEEINRRIVDHISAVCYTTTDGAARNLIREGHAGDKVVLVGNVMVDTLVRSLPRAAHALTPTDIRWLSPYALLTLHRAENVDDRDKIATIISAVDEVATRIPVIFPVHPRTLKNIPYHQHIQCVPPLSYLKFIWMMKNAQFVMTDSGGIQEETTALGVPCMTLRESTERPETVLEGTNVVVGVDPHKIVATVSQIVTYRDYRLPRCPQLWDGHAAERILSDLVTRG